MILLKNCSLLLQDEFSPIRNFLDSLSPSEAPAFKWQFSFRNQYLHNFCGDDNSFISTIEHISQFTECPEKYAKKILIWVIFIIILKIFNRLGVAGAVLQTPPLLINSLIKSLSHRLWKYLQNTVSPKP